LSQTTTPQVSIVIPHLNQPELLHKLLTSLHAQDFDMSRAEVIIVDNGSRELPHGVIADFPGTRLETEATPGPGPARNLGAARSTAPILAFTDSDCHVAADWLKNIMARFESDPDLKILGGDIRMTTEIPGQATPAEAFECIYAYNQRDYIKRLGFSVTANLAMRRAVFEAVGSFAGIDIAEDMDWGERATVLGHETVYAPDMVIYHPARRDMAELCAKWDRNISHHFRVRAGDKKGKVKWVASAFALMVSAPAEIPTILKSKRVSTDAERWQAFIGLARVRLYRGWRMLTTLASPAGGHGSPQWNRD
jgi:GT2 family glycosyltransferase